MAATRGRLVARGLLVLVLAVVVGVTTFVGGLLAAPLDVRAVPPAPKPVLLLGADGTQFGQIRPAQRREVLPGDQIPEVVRQAIISAEDARFLDHRGVDPLATLRAAYRDLTGGRRQGGSTITQQYVKNVYVGNDRTFARKIREASVAVRLEQRKSKDEILTDYLNVLYLGNSTYGVQAASLLLLRRRGAGARARRRRARPARPTRCVALARASMLAGIAPAPSAWNPVRDFAQARGAAEVHAQPDGRRRLHHLRRGQRGLPPRGRRRARSGSRRRSRRAPRRSTPTSSPRSCRSSSPTTRTCSTAAACGCGRRSTPTCRRPSPAPPARCCPTRTTRRRRSSPSTSAAATSRRMTTLRRRPAARRPRGRHAATPAAASTSPTNGRRSTGSTIKPFTLAAALEQGLTLDTRRDAPACDAIADPGAEGGRYEYCNAAGEGGSSRRLTLQRALQRSVNTVYVPLAIEAGRDRIKQLMLDAGVVADEDAFATGAVVVRPRHDRAGQPAVDGQRLRHAA